MVFGDKLWLKFTFPVSGDINLELPILALKGFGRLHTVKDTNSTHAYKHTCHKKTGKYNNYGGIG